MEKKDAKYDIWFETKDGCLVGYLFHGLRYDSKVEITNDVINIINEDDKGFQESKLPDLAELVREGEIMAKYTYNEFTIKYKRGTYLYDKQIARIIKKFKKNGFNVTAEAIKHNYEAYRIDHKSGYRDEVNGYHLFSPCGCNDLSFCATDLCEQSDDWQVTYDV